MLVEETSSDASPTPYIIPRKSYQFQITKNIGTNDNVQFRIETSASMAKSISNRVFEDYDPPSDLVTEEAFDTILIYLPGFQKEHLKVQLTISRMLKISGERPLGDHKYRRFQKEFRIPFNCDTKEISAKFEGGILYIRQPKLITPAPPPAKASATPSYVDFDPKSELKEEHGADTLIISLPGFKKEQLRVQVNNVGVLKVSGEKQEYADPTKMRRFIKETTVPEHCDINSIRAKFANGELHVIMPKKVMTPPHPVTEKTLGSLFSAPQKSEDTPLPTAETARPTDQKMDLQSDVNAKVGRAKDQVVGFGGDLARKLQGMKNNVDLPNDVSSKMGRAKDQVVGLGGDLVRKLQGRKNNVDLPSDINAQMGRAKEEVVELREDLGKKLQGKKNNNNVAIGLGVAMVAMVAIGAFVAYKYGCSTSSYMED